MVVGGIEEGETQLVLGSLQGTKGWRLRDAAAPKAAEKTARGGGTTNPPSVAHGLAESQRPDEPSKSRTTER